MTERIKVSGCETTVRNVEITVDHRSMIDHACNLATTHYEMFRILRCQIKRSFDLETGAYINDGKWYIDSESYGGSHSWTDTKTIREATEYENQIMQHMFDMEELFTAKRLSEPG